MNTAARYFLLVLLLVISIHYILSFTHEPYGRATTFSGFGLFQSGKDRSKENSKIPAEYHSAPDDDLPLHSNGSLATDPTAKRANAAFVILCRNSDTDSIIRSISDMEFRFNRRYKYPYVLLNEEKFTEEFKTRVSALSSAKMEFGVIPHDHWYQPDWIDEPKAEKARIKLQDEGVIYGGSVSYRNMCRFNSGFFFKHPLVQKYRWYWRIEPDVHFHCDVDYDPFLFMQEQNKVYGFVITMYEFDKTIPTLWGHTKDFIKLHPEYVAKGNAMGYMSDDNGNTFNKCHFWSNFEIADMEFWRSPAYQDYFEYLDSKGGFYYERWGDAPVHSIAAALFLKKEQIHFFSAMGYEHNPYVHCPSDAGDWKRGRCSCNPQRNFDYDGYSCMRQWDRIQ
ncbi:glycosyltransferase family 15 protein [Mycena floridula]|nr:glycosyltransferase family 15 protein [Mycena floridula]